MWVLNTNGKRGNQLSTLKAKTYLFLPPPFCLPLSVEITRTALTKHSPAKINSQGQMLENFWIGFRGARTPLGHGIKGGVEQK
ncbi:hypothetical protein DRN62_04115 [Nanoarchaeota archaeon]|nr:MAG: hypothetical protein DRN62_04115 [Nanoarchaeota archaeon]